MPEGGLNYGQALPDQVERIAELFDSQLEVINDVQELYTARVALEREYASKLQMLTRKASEKKAKAHSAFVFGKEPTKSWDGDALRQSTLNQAYDEIIQSMADTAQDHSAFSDILTSQLIEVLKILEKRNEDAKKKEMSFFQKLLSDRDRAYNDRLKNKQKYDEECAEVESIRQKQGRAADDKHVDRAAKQAEQQRNDMLNSKNSYLISTAIANRAKAVFYSEDIPQLENELQMLQRRLVLRFVKILVHGQHLHLKHLDSLKTRIANAEMKFEQVDVVKDQDLFISYNVRNFIAPDDWKFEPSAIHYDTDSMSVESAPKIVIQNKLRRSREKIKELNPLVESKRTLAIDEPPVALCSEDKSGLIIDGVPGAELNELSAQISFYSADNTVGAIDDLTDKYLEATHQLVLYSVSERILSAEIETIVSAVGDDEGSSRPHSFKSSSFSIPTQCGYCNSSIWGLSKQGKTCRTCGLSVHAKCELKVPANCEGAEEHQSTTSFKRNTNVSRFSDPEPTPAIPPSASSFVQSISSEDVPEEVVEARVLYDFKATSEFELAVREGKTVQVIEADDGSGWVKVVNENDESGLVPASYLEMVADISEGREIEDGGGGGKHVRAIYPYTAQGDDELGLQPGDILTLSSGPTGGENYGDGWWEGFNNQGRKGIFPNNYVESL